MIIIVIGLHDKKLEERLSREINLILDRTIELTRSHTKAIQQGISYSNDYNVDAI